MRRKRYAEELSSLKEAVLRMGGLVERMTQRAVQTLVERKPEMFDDVRAMEPEVNQLCIDIDGACLEIIALRQPAAKDLRFITAAMKINTDLERIGDQAVNITESGKRLLAVPELKPLIDIPRMAQVAQEMLRDALNAFVNGDDRLAEKTIPRDNEMDQLKDQIFRELLTYMMSDPTTIPRATDLILVSRHLERVADHATNVCEDVIFMVRGKVFRDKEDVA